MRYKTTKKTSYYMLLHTGKYLQTKDTFVVLVENICNLKITNELQYTPKFVAYRNHIKNVLFFVPTVQTKQKK